jgi:uncharacterized DUF497 family protein
MKITFDPVKNRVNLKKHGIDLGKCARIFDLPMLTEEDTRLAYGEARHKSLEFLKDRVVVLVWTERADDIRLISCRYGDKHETRRYFTIHG